MTERERWKVARGGAPTALGQLQTLLGSTQHLVDTLLGTLGKSTSKTAAA